MVKEKSYDERKQEVEELSQLINEITASGGVLSIGYYELMTITPNELRKLVYEQGNSIVVPRGAVRET